MIPVNHNHHDHNEIDEKKPKTLKQKIKIFFIKNSMVLFFIIMFIIDFLCEILIFLNSFELSIEKKAYKFFSILFFVLTFSIYIILLNKSPSQTNIELVMEKEKKRIIPSQLLKLYPKFCDFCEKRRKFERSSHCRNCKVCVLRRDHHCSFINKCVGFSNNKLFFLYIIYQYFFAFIFFRGFVTYYFKENTNTNINKFHMLISIISTLITLLLFFWVSGLLFSLITTYLNNFSQYEYTVLKVGILDNVCIPLNKNIDKSKNEYNLGWLFNLENILGPSIFHFFLPLPFEVKTQFDEEKKVFKKSIDINPCELTRELSGVVFDSIDNIIKSQIEISNPSSFMENCREYYDLPNIIII